jgi:hypothetical protein
MTKSCSDRDRFGRSWCRCASFSTTANQFAIALFMRSVFALTYCAGFTRLANDNTVFGFATRRPAKHNKAPVERQTTAANIAVNAFLL